MKLTDHFSTRKTVLTENNAGGPAFALDEWAKLDRFLILGSEGGTYYVTEGKLTRDNALNVQRCIELDGSRVVRRTVEISTAGRAAKNDYALFVLAMCTGLGNEEARSLALSNLPKVARIGTHLFLFAEFVEAFRGWGRSLKRAIAHWYNEQECNRLLYQAMKYQQREGWSHRDLLRLCHAKTDSEQHQALYDWICSNKEEKRREKALSLFPRLQAVQALHAGIEETKGCGLIVDHQLPREVLPTTLLNSTRIWEALLTDMPITALIRNLGKMTQVGVISDLSDGEEMALEKLSNKEILKKGRVHPLTILSALMTYQQGSGIRGKLKWKPTSRIVEALEKAFYDSFENVVPTNKRIMMAVDVSGSMFFGNIAGSPLTPGDAAAALSMVTKAVESHCIVKAFSHTFIDFVITDRMSLKNVIHNMRQMGFGGTDCTLPITYATEEQIPIDAFVVLTDSETWVGQHVPSAALRHYREVTGIDAKLIVCGMTANDITIADPDDAGMLDVVGFDTSTPEIISNFIRGQI